MGLIIDEKEYKVVERKGKKGDQIPEHNHPEAKVVFTVVEGKIEICLEGEKKIVTQGDIVNFDGNKHISAEFLEDGKAFVTLIIKEK